MTPHRSGQSGRSPIAGIVRCVAALLLWNLPSTVQARDFVRRFDNGKPSWNVRRTSAARLVAQRRVGRPGERYEYAQLKIAKRGRLVLFEHPLPTISPRDGVIAVVRWNCNQAGAVVALRVVFPGTTDPKTRAPISTLIVGERDVARNKWRTLKVELTATQLAARVRELQTQFRDRGVTLRNAKVSQVVVALEPEPGTLYAGFAELRYGELSKPPTRKQKKEKSPILRASHERADKHPVEFRLDRLRVNGAPFFPRMIAWHREEPRELQVAGYNLVWIPDYNDARAIRAFRDVGMWLTATPPKKAEVTPGADAAARRRRLFGNDTRPILFWNVGTRIPTSARKRLIEWVGRIRQADRHFDRPIIGDVAGDEAVYSRHVSMLGLSRHVIHTDFSLKNYRDWLVRKRRLARPGTFVWTWIQTEPRANADGRLAKDDPLVVEPEQIRLQVYAALAAGCRGIGYWKTTSLDEKRPGFDERKMMIAQLNLELDLITPWITTGTVVARTAFRVDDDAADRFGQRRINLGARSAAERRSLRNAGDDQARRRKSLGSELEAAVIRSEHGTLLLPIWYGANAQFVPDKLVAANARIVVHGVSESASAYEVSTTGVRSLASKRVAGGIEVTIPRFNQTAAVVLTADRKAIERLKVRAAKMASHSAALYVGLAEAKHKRVRGVNEALAKLGTTQPDAPQLLHKAGLHAAAARMALKSERYASARREAENAMQMLRILQRAHWDDAVRSLPSPVATPFAVSFQSLPEHYKLLARYGDSDAGSRGNLLPTGDFEDFDKMTVEGWKHTQHPHASLRAVAELYPKGRRGNYSLRLVAAPIPGKPIPTALTRPVVTVHSPPLSVAGGQIVKISGWVKISTGISGHTDGAMLYDNIGGSSRALRWRNKTGWQKFALLRVVPRRQQLRITLVLNGMGEVRFDDLRAVVHTPKTVKPTPPPATTPEPATRERGFFDRLPRFPSFPRPTLPEWARPRFGSSGSQERGADERRER